VGCGGVLHGIAVWVAIALWSENRAIALALGGGLVLKVLAEQTVGMDLGSSKLIGVAVLVNAHLYGASLAAAMAVGRFLVLQWLRKR
jgi:hypothetical protein